MLCTWFCHLIFFFLLDVVCWRSISLYLRAHSTYHLLTLPLMMEMWGVPRKMANHSLLLLCKSVYLFCFKNAQEECSFLIGLYCSFHTLIQSVPLTLSRMWNAVHFVLVKLVTDNVFPLAFPLPAERGPIYCAPGSHTGCCYTWLPSGTKVSEIRPSTS